VCSSDLVIRLTALGMRQVPEGTKEAALAFGCTKRLLLRDVEIPLAMPSIMAGWLSMRGFA